MKCNRRWIVFGFIAIVFLLFLHSVYAIEHLPKGLLKIQEQNTLDAQNTLQNVTILIAFVAGILTMLSPCLLPLLPAFFAYTFKDRKKITLMTSIFFVGFAISFIALGLLAAFVGDVSITMFQQGIGPLVMIAGVLLIIMGGATILDKGFPGMRVVTKYTNTKWGTFLYGITFALGWSVCVGPILTGVLLMASILNNYFYAMLLMLFYALGMVVPLFVMAIVYDRYDLSKLQCIRGRELQIGTLRVHSTTFMSGLLLIFTGLIFLVYQSTANINSIWYFGLKNYFYSIQELILKNIMQTNIVGGLLLGLFVFIFWLSLKKKKSHPQ